MLSVCQVLTMIFIAVVMTLALAHALLKNGSADCSTCRFTV